MYSLKDEYYTERLYNSALTINKKRVSLIDSILMLEEEEDDYALKSILQVYHVPLPHARVETSLFLKFYYLINRRILNLYLILMRVQ